MKKKVCNCFGLNFNFIIDLMRTICTHVYITKFPHFNHFCTNAHTTQHNPNEIGFDISFPISFPPKRVFHPHTQQVKCKTYQKRPWKHVYPFIYQGIWIILEIELSEEINYGRVDTQLNKHNVSNLLRQ